ncbi:MAG: hypothetical protein QNK37_38580 [Acidobacteriota bacterium]|nr:hypothetical protein [Acidobacteriota bacterium]
MLKLLHPQQMQSIKGGRNNRDIDMADTNPLHAETGGAVNPLFDADDD